ncbi:cytochrome P450 2F2-like [Hyla sarda]|uniref:cytochrome P450 2F2-like n=1 Tax=Hyla sarda TaxID=327740 RepID=UPI0024C256F9|nr:cytochrome P450 2F2-like [Hyla sarda]XP_056397467.1 cytochrome P450 2F2-like [Hyla sarda]XP_056397468.1 cytochrome P450 2F2-like [Hyla sarda]
MDFYSLVTVLLVILITVVLAKYTKILLDRSELPPGPTPLPIIGTLHLMNLNDIVKSLLDLSKKYGDIFTVYEWSQPVIVLCGHKAIKETLIDKAEEFSGRAYYPVFFDVTKGDDIAFSNGEQWKELRRFAMLTLGNFGVGKSSFEERIREEAQYLTDVLKKSNGSPIDPNYHMERCVSNVTCSVMFGSRFEYKDEHFQKLVKCVRDNFRIMSSCWGLLYNICPSVMKHLPGPHRKILENFVFLATFIKNKMENNMKTLDSNNPRDYIDCFLIKMEKEKKNTSTFYNPNTLVMSSVGLFFAGTETVTLTLRFMLLYFIKHPSIAEKVYREIDEVIGQRPPTYEDRHYMPYTAAFINEVLRYADVIPLSLPHKLTADTQIGNYRFKKGTAFTPLLSSVHNDKSLFNNPENFDPNNFLNENGELKKTESWFPFSAGKRLCLGKSLAVVELFIFTTTLLQNFTIKSSVPPEKISVTPVGVGLGHIPPSFEACFLPRMCSSE